MVKSTKIVLELYIFWILSHPRLSNETSSDSDVFPLLTIQFRLQLCIKSSGDDGEDVGQFSQATAPYRVGHSK